MMQGVEITEEEKIVVYMNFDKQRLIKMLIHCQKIIKSNSGILNNKKDKTNYVAISLSCVALGVLIGRFMDEVINKL